MAKCFLLFILLFTSVSSLGATGPYRPEEVKVSGCRYLVAGHTFLNERASQELLLFALDRTRHIEVLKDSPAFLFAWVRKVILQDAEKAFWWLQKLMKEKGVALWEMDERDNLKFWGEALGSLNLEKELHNVTLERRVRTNGVWPNFWDGIAYRLNFFEMPPTETPLVNLPNFIAMTRLQSIESQIASLVKKLGEFTVRLREDGIVTYKRKGASSR